MMIHRVSILLAAALVACGPTAAPPDTYAPSADAGASVDAAAAAAASDPVAADEVEIVGGVPDRNRDPAVVAIDIGGAALCTGTLVSPRLVLTARHCVSRTDEQVSCPSVGPQILANRDPRQLSILVGDDVRTARLAARGLELVVPSSDVLCDSDIAFVVLDKAVTSAKALPIAKTGAARGDFVRAVGFGLQGSEDPTAGSKLVREHVRVLSVSKDEFTVGEATCQGDSGGPALDEDTGEIVGVVSRGGPSCEGPSVHNIYTRVDAFSALAEEAFARVAGLDKPDAGAPAPRGSQQKPPSDLGGPCQKGSDCAAGICVTDGTRQYCSRACGQGDRCPARFNCRPVSVAGSTSAGSTSSVCINVR